MELDKRIMKGKKPLDCFDAENKELIKPFLNKEGYVSNNLATYCFLDKCPKRFLSNVFKEVRNCFKTCINDGDGGSWKYFLPIEWVKEPEKKFRPFTPEEFVAEFPVGSKIIYRHIGEDREINIVVITRIETTEDFEFINVYFGTDLPWKMKYMFETLEIKIDSKWQPFGIEE